MKLLALLLALLAPSPSFAQVKNPDTYTFLTISDADSLDPAWSYDTASHMLILNIYEPLVFYKGSSSSELEPIIATKVPSKKNGLISADGRTYTFPIRKGVKFHDGTPMTPEDVRYSLMRFMLLDRDAGPSWMLLEPLLGEHGTRDEKGKVKPGIFKRASDAVQVKGDNVVLTLPKPYAPLLSILASWAPVVSREWVAKKGGWDGTEATWEKYNNPTKEASPLHEAANGTGAFKLARWDRRTKQVILDRNDAYWRAPAKLRSVVIKSVNEFGTRKLMLTAGDADAIYAAAPEWSQVQNIPGVEIIDNLPTIEMNPVAYFTFQINAVGNPNIGSGKLDGEGIPPDFFSDLDLRKAFAYSFDYKGYIKDVFRGQATQATGCVPSSLPEHNPKQKTYQLDLAKAKEHFQKAKGGQVWEKGFKFTLTYNVGNPYRQTLCQILKRNVESLNPKFRIDVRPVEWPTFLDQYRASKLPIFTLGWHADFPDAHSFAYPLMHSKGDYPHIQKYKNAEADALIEKAVGETNAAKRTRMYHRVMQIEHEDVPHLIFVDSKRYRTQRSWVKGFVPSPIFPDAPYGSYFYPMYKSQ